MKNVLYVLSRSLRLKMRQGRSQCVVMVVVRMGGGGG